VRRLLRWIGYTLAGLAGLAVVAYVAVFVLSERVLRRTYDLPRVAVSVPTDAASIREGQRLATVRGCYTGCHGQAGKGAVMFDVPMIARVVAPNLTAAAHKYSDAELAAIIRNGVRPDGHSLVIMPSEVFAALTDEDLGRILAFLKSLPEVAGPGPGVSLGPLGRAGLAVGKFKMAAQLITDAVPPPGAVNEEAARGRYLARTICAQCHGTNLEGASNPDFTSPSLRTVAAYTSETFGQLMRTGVAAGGRNLATMSPWARVNLSHLTDSEIAALFTYLHALPETTHE
jgi:mono/diheme cytochrome c family protein